MKTIFTFLFVALAFVSSAQAAVIPVAEDQFGALILDMQSHPNAPGTFTVNNGDIIEFTTSGGTYEIDSLTFEVNKNVTVRAASSCTEKPIIQKVYYDFGVEDPIHSLVQLVGNVDVVFDGISYSGSFGLVKYAIISQRTVDFFGRGSEDGGGIPNFDAYIDSVSNGFIPDEPLQTLNLSVINCNIDSIYWTSYEGSGIQIYPGVTVELMKIENTFFSNIAREGFRAYLTIDERTRNSWNFVDSMAVINSTFYNIREEAVHIEGQDSESFDGNTVYINHCTIDSCGTRGQYVLSLKENKVTLVNSIVSNNSHNDGVFYITHTESYTDYMGFWKVDNINADIGSNIFVEEPTFSLYADAANGDFTLNPTSSFIGAASDGEVLGYICWGSTPDARLSSLKVNGALVEGFSSYKNVYNVELPEGTTALPKLTATCVAESLDPEITNVTALHGTASVLVTTSGGKTNTYTVNFTVAKNSYSTLSELMVNGNFVGGFSPLTYTYDLAVTPSANLPELTASPTNSKASIDIINTTSVPGTAAVEVTAENGSKQTYTVNFSIATSLNATSVINNVIVYQSNDLLNIKCNEELIDSRLELFDLYGRFVYSNQINGTHEQIYLDAKGLFIVRILNTENKLVFSTKIAVN